jgi:hypothetical protein
VPSLDNWCTSAFFYFDFLVFRDKVFLCNPDKSGTHYVAQTSLETAILLPQSPECWDYRCLPPFCSISAHVEVNSSEA